MNSARRIKILEDVVVNQIAAGEVIERPASVVKELVENALDAGATSIRVLIANGGMSAIEVLDDGTGIHPDDVSSALQRFGTSKISAADDLLSIASFGFRGEALPSIASVSKLALHTSTDGVSGMRVAVNGGSVGDVQIMPRERGTRVSVETLFFNVPARKRFMRTEAYETSVIRSTLADLSLAHPEVRFALTADGKETLSVAPTKSIAERARELGFGGKNPIEVLRSGAGFQLHAVISRPTESTHNAQKLRLLVNRRPVRDRLLLRAVRDAFGTMLGPGRYPHGVVVLDVPPAEVDVNVHPQKSEVRFRDSSRIFTFVKSSIGDALTALRGGSSPDGSRENAFTGGATTAKASVSYPSFTFAPSSSSASFFTDQERPAVAFSVSETAAPTGQLSSLRFIAQVFDCYLIFEGVDCLRVVDMHAAHERVVFDKLKRSLLHSGNLASQQLLIPELIPVTAEVREQIAARLGEFQRLGFDLELFDEQLVVRATPELLRMNSAAEFFAELLDAEGWEGWMKHLDDALDEILSRLACHGSIRSGRQLERAEVYQLLHDIERVDAGGLCPHGRPVICEITQGELESLFGRA